MIFSQFLLLFSLGTAIASFIFVGWIRKIAIKRAIIDVPNERSSHSQPTPRGGGSAIVVSAIVSIVALYLLKPELFLFSGEAHANYLAGANNWILAFGVGGAVIGVLGWLDDCFNLPMSLRLSVHFIASIWAVYLLSPSNIPILLQILAIFWVAWSINFYNFMDGIDGLAASQAVFVGLAGCYIYGKLGILPISTISLQIAAASFGFLIWNLPPAKIFMGDVGSSFLGYSFGCLSIGSGLGFKGGIGTWVILLAFFWGDATPIL